LQCEVLFCNVRFVLQCEVLFCNVRFVLQCEVLFCNVRFVLQCKVFPSIDMNVMTWNLVVVCNSKLMLQRTLDVSCSGIYAA
jgi:hypothetical protein